jgi:DNA-binding beta-propeller fold protein YncE
MLANQEPDWNIDDLTDYEIYDAIRYLDTDPRTDALLYLFGCGVTSTLAPNTTTGTTYLYIGGAVRSDANPLLVGSVVQFRVNGDGTLSALTPATVSTGTTVILSWGMTVTPSNQHLLILNDSIGEFGIGQGGTLTATSAPATTGNSIAFTPDGKFAVIVNSANSTLTSYSAGSSDALTQINTVATGGYPQIAAVDKSGKFAYVSNFR